MKNIEELNKYLDEHGIKKMNITSAYSMGDGEKPTDEQLAKEALRFLRASEKGVGLVLSEQTM